MCTLFPSDFELLDSLNNFENRYTGHVTSCQEYTGDCGMGIYAPIGNGENQTLLEPQQLP